MHLSFLKNSWLDLPVKQLISRSLSSVLLVFGVVQLRSLDDRIVNRTHSCIPQLYNCQSEAQKFSVPVVLFSAGSVFLCNFFPNVSAYE